MLRDAQKLAFSDALADWKKPFRRITDFALDSEGKWHCLHCNAKAEREDMQRNER